MIIISLIALIVTVPVVTLVVVAVNACYRDASAATSTSRPVQMGALRLAAAGSAVVGLDRVLGDEVVRAFL